MNITGLTIEDGIAGIAITETGDNSRIVGCNVTKNQRGVSAMGSAINLVKVSIIDNTITNNSETGVYAYQTNGLRVGGNEITDNGASSNMDLRDMGGSGSIIVFWGASRTTLSLTTARLASTS